MSQSFLRLRRELLPRVDAERYGISNEFKSLFSIFKLKLSVDPESLLALNPSDELDSVPKLCPECNGPLFLLFRKPRLCPCCKRAVLCESCFQKHALTVDVQEDPDIKSVTTHVCAQCLRQAEALQERARAARAFKAGLEGAGAGAQDEIALIYPEVARLIDIGNRRLARYRSLCEAVQDSGAPEVAEVGGVVEQIKLCRAQVQGYVGKLRGLKYPPRSSRQRMQDNLAIYAFDWLNTTRAEFTALSEHLRKALLRKPAADPTAPQIDSVVPTIAPLMGASPLLIRGRNLPPGTQVFIQGSLCRVVSRTEKAGGGGGGGGDNSNKGPYTEITVLSVPSKKEGLATVSVIAPDGKTAALEGFCYVKNELFTESDVKSLITDEQQQQQQQTAKKGAVAAAATTTTTTAAMAAGLFIQQVNPAVLPLKGGRLVISAMGVKEGVLVEINGKVLTPVSVSVETGEVVVKAPRCKEGAYSVRLTNTDGATFALDGILMYTKAMKASHTHHRRHHHHHHHYHYHNPLTLHKSIKAIIVEKRTKIKELRAGKKEGNDNEEEEEAAVAAEDNNDSDENSGSCDGNCGAGGSSGGGSSSSSSSCSGDGSSSSSSKSGDYDEFNDDGWESEGGNDDGNNNGNDEGFVIVGNAKPATPPPKPPSTTSSQQQQQPRRVWGKPSAH